jgi:large subunit ribosomal protein L25
MPEITLVAETGRTTGTRPSRRLRHEGRIPAVVYGTGTEPTSVTVPWRDLRAALTTDAGLNAVINLTVDGSTHLTLVKDLQRHPVRRDVLHVDFLVVDKNKAVSVEVPIHVVGEHSDELKAVDAVVDQVLFHLTMHAKPADIPDNIEVDVSTLTLDTPIRVGDLPLPAGATTDVDPEEAVLIAAVVVADMGDAEEGEAAAEGEDEGAAEAAADEAGEAEAAADEAPAED